MGALRMHHSPARREAVRAARAVLRGVRAVVPSCCSGAATAVAAAVESGAGGTGLWRGEVVARHVWAVEDSGAA